MANQFQQAMRLMRSNDAQTQEDGFHQLRPHVAQHLDELIIEQLHGDDESLRSWAVRGLDRIDTRQARRELYQARTAGLLP
ncbi:hypothetical protein ACFYPX_14130 [Micromonospora zamorensis]|uniref:hypothetical protein n=1 Tax=Micromonospora zamorensis TaxID=709883 RepID=UPI0036D1E0AA